MESNPLLGVLMLLVGGAATGSFYVPFGKVKQWSWESYWLAMGAVSWAVVPILVAWVTVPGLVEILCKSPSRGLVLAYLFGAMWGVGAITFGLTVRYLGISLGMAIVIGLSAVLGTLVPPIVEGRFVELLSTSSGLTVLLGVLVCAAGIVICGYSGIRKENELTDQQKKEAVKEFDLIKGFVVAIVSGVMSAGLAYGVTGGQPIAETAQEMGVSGVYQNNPVLVVVLGGGFTVNLFWCLALNIRNRSTHQYWTGPGSLLLANYFFVILAGVLWYLGMFLYGTSITKMGDYAFSCWSSFTAFGIIFSTLWGLFLKEWNGVKRRTLWLLWSGVLVLILSTIVTGVGSFLATTV